MLNFSQERKTIKKKGNESFLLHLGEGKEIMHFFANQDNFFPSPQYLRPSLSPADKTVSFGSETESLKKSVVVINKSGMY